ncbi:MAG: hypothetical protein U0271_08585 [Polyangiaceae bacterium]
MLGFGSRAGALLVTGAVLLGSSSLVGCAARQSPTAPLVLHIPPDDVSDSAFAGSLHRVLLSGERADARSRLLLGVVRRQLVHASARFGLESADAQAAADRGERSTLAALMLLRADEQSDAIIDDETRRAIEVTIARRSARGDVGGVRALLAALIAETPDGPAKTELVEHLASLNRFAVDTLTGTRVERAGDAERALVMQALFDPTGVDAAVDATSQWIDLAIIQRLAVHQTELRLEPEEAIEVNRALSTGPLTLLALAMRYGDAVLARDLLMRSSARRIAEPALVSALNNAVRRDDAVSYRKLLTEFVREVDDVVGGQNGVDADLYDAAVLAMLIEIHRRAPTDLDAAVELADALSSFGLAEAAPLVLADAIGERSTGPEIERALTTAGRAADADAAVGDLGGARRTIAASAALLDSVPKLERGRYAAQAARLRYRFARVLLRDGQLDEALSHLDAALAVEDDPRSLLLRADVRARLARTTEALADLERAVSIRGLDPVAIAEAELARFAILREKGNHDDALTALERASAASKRATRTAMQAAEDAVYAARVWAVEGRIASAERDDARARAAFDRALSGRLNDRALAGEITLVAATAALSRDDLEGARAALRLGMAGGAPKHAIVRAAIVVVALERAEKQRPDRKSASSVDEVADEVLERAASEDSWTGQLARWARGELSGKALAARAATESSRVEAAFYVALDARATGRAADEALRAVASSPVFEQPEVLAARDLVAPPLVGPDRRAR